MLQELADFGVKDYVPWFDPPLAGGFSFTAFDGTHFTTLQMPVGLGSAAYTVSDGVDPPVSVAAGGTYTFPAPVTSFTVTGILPGVDAGSSTAFPIALGLDQLGYFAMTPIPVPESESAARICKRTDRHGVAGETQARGKSRRWVNAEERDVVLPTAISTGQYSCIQSLLVTFQQSTGCLSPRH